MANVAQQFELAGIAVNLNAESFAVAASAADVMLTALLYAPLAVDRPLVATSPTLSEETDVPGL